MPVINTGLSGDTTTAARARLIRLPPTAHAIVLLGTNDARRHGEQDMLVSHSETLRRSSATRVCLTWQLEDVATTAALVRDAWPDTIDLWPAFGPEHLGYDGLHPSLAGATTDRIVRPPATRRTRSAP